MAAGHGSIQLKRTTKTVRAATMTAAITARRDFARFMLRIVRRQEAGREENLQASRAACQDEGTGACPCLWNAAVPRKATISISGNPLVGDGSPRTLLFAAFSIAYAAFGLWLGVRVVALKTAGLIGLAEIGRTGFDARH
jgi:hypothetical protein